MFVCIKQIYSLMHPYMEKANIHIDKYWIDIHACARICVYIRVFVVYVSPESRYTYNTHHTCTYLCTYVCV